jgi:Cu(I)/Ag(I) efflux system membrane protein CusA/SilA
MIGGMVSSTVLTLVVIPAIYALIKGMRLPSEAPVPVTKVAKARGRRRTAARAG